MQARNMTFLLLLNMCISKLNMHINAMITNHLRARYVVYFTKNRTLSRRPYGARLAAGRIVRFFVNF